MSRNSSKIFERTWPRSSKNVKKPKLTRTQWKAPLNRTLEHKDRTIDEWKRGIWLDETKINLINSDDVRYALMKDPNNLISKLMNETVKFGGGNLMIWECMSWYGVGGMEKIVG